MADLKLYYPIVEEAIRSFGVDPGANRGPYEGSWLLSRGSASVLVDVRQVKSFLGERDILVIFSKICDLPAQVPNELYIKLLQENHKFVNEKFSIYQNELCLTSNRDLEGMDANEVKRMIDSMSFVADALDDKIKAGLGVA